MIQIKIKFNSMHDCHGPVIKIYQNNEKLAMSLRLHVIRLKQCLSNVIIYKTLRRRHSIMLFDPLI